MKYREAVLRAALEVPLRLGEVIVTISMFLGAFFSSFWLWGKHVSQPTLKAFGDSLPAGIAWTLGLSPMLAGLIALLWAGRLLKADFSGSTTFKRGPSHD